MQLAQILLLILLEFSSQSPWHILSCTQRDEQSDQEDQVGPFDRCILPEKYLICNIIMGHLDDWVVSYSALNIGNISTLWHTLGHEFGPRWQQTLYWTQAEHLCFFHDSIWFIWLNTIFCVSNLSCELWNRKLKINYFFKKMNMLHHCLTMPKSR